MAKPAFQKPGRLHAVYGITRTGKGKWVISRISQKKAALVWDLKGDVSEYPCQWRARTIPALKAALLKSNPGMICYTGSKADFQQFCVLARLFCEKFRGDGALVIDETSDITGNAGAAGAYGELLRKALNLGCDIYSMAQRAAEADKTTLANASFFHFSTPGTPADCKKMSDICGIPLNIISALAPDFEKSRFDCIDCERGHWWQLMQLQFKNNRAVFVQKAPKTHFYKK